MILRYTDLQIAPRSRLARRSDPSTSHASAARAEAFKTTHEGRILAAIKVWCKDDDGFPPEEWGVTPPYIADECGLTIHAVGKRLNAMQEKGLISLLVYNGEVVIRDGFRVWVTGAAE